VAVADDDDDGQIIFHELSVVARTSWINMRYICAVDAIMVLETTIELPSRTPPGSWLRIQMYNNWKNREDPKEKHVHFFPKCCRRKTHCP
jgi:hypothetical protein